MTKPTDLTADEIAELERLEAAATKAWNGAPSFGGFGPAEIWSCSLFLGRFDTQWQSLEQRAANRDLTVALRNAAPALIAMAKRCAEMEQDRWEWGRAEHNGKPAPVCRKCRRAVPVDEMANHEKHCQSDISLTAKDPAT